MARKGENIFKRKDGRWEARYIKGRELSGKIRYGYCYGHTYREAREKAARCKAEVLSGAVPAEKDRRLFSAFCQEWLELERTRVKESTYVKYENTLRKHILPRLGDCRPQGFTTQLMGQFSRELSAEGLAPKTVRDILAVLGLVLKYTAEQFPGTFPNVEIVYPREEKRETRVLTPEEQRTLAAWLRKDMDECKFGVLLAMATGLRIGELCAMRWEQVSVRDRTLRVTATMQRLRDVEGAGEGKTKIVIGSPKSGSSARVIPLTESAAALCARFDPQRPEAYLLTGTEEYMEPRKLQRRFKSYTDACGLEGVHFHTIRHTFATRCVEAGFEIKSLSEVLGHADTSITLNRYVHSSMELKRENMDKLAVEF